MQSLPMEDNSIKAKMRRQASTDNTTATASTAPRTANGRFSSRLVQSLLALLGTTIAVHHLLLTSNQLYSATEGQGLRADQPSQNRLLLMASNVSGTTGSDCSGSESNSQEINLDTLSNHVGHSSQLSSEEKEQLMKTIQQLAEDKNNPQDQDAQEEDQDAQEEDQEEEEELEEEQAVGEISTEDHTFELNATSPYAYMFVIGGINEDRPAYKGFLYDVLIATRLLQQLGSTADVVLYTQMSPDSKLDGLPEEDMKYLRALNVQVLTLTKPTKESFAGLVFEKFRALQMTQYKRVLFLDADAIPLANLDYLFHLSDPEHLTTPTILRSNLIMASRGEPCNAGMFMLKPEMGAWDELLEIIHRQREEGKQMPYPHFSWNRGWGYDFEAEGDVWRGTVKTGARWRYHAGHSDQGLLYYWVKFHKRDVSIIIQDEVENWMDAGPNGNTTVDGKPKPILQMTLPLEPLAAYSSEKPLAHQFNCDQDRYFHSPKKNKPHQCVVPYRDFAHFMGGSKPWMIWSPKNFLGRNKDTAKYNAPTRLWYNTLGDLNKELKMDLDFNKWHEKHDIKEAPLGSMAKHSDLHGDHAALKTDNTKELDKKDDKKGADIKA